MMALSTTYKHPKGKMHNKKCIFFKKRGAIIMHAIPMRCSRVVIIAIP